MKAITYSSYGPPGVLRLSDVAKPIASDDELLIRVRAVEATKSDCELRSFHYAVKWFWLPLRIAVGIARPKRPILGSYFAGEVVGIGKAVRDFSVGDQVFGSTRLRMGAYAEYVSVPASYTVTAKPRNMSYTDAAAVPLGGLNALHFMRRAAIRPGESVLINGAGGSIGAHAIQIAKSMGAEVTAVDVGYKRAICRLGADHFIDYTQQDFTALGRSYDVIFDMVASSSYSACLKLLKPNGRYLSGNPRLSVMARSVLTSRFTDKTASFEFARETRQELEALRELIERTELKSIVDTVYPLAQAATAHERVEKEQRLGAIVLSVNET